MGKHWANGYSSYVELSLRINGKSYPLAQVGANNCILNGQARCIPGVPAEIIITVDGREEVHEVLLAESAAKTSRVRFVDAAQAS